MSGNAKFRFLLAPIFIVLFVVTSPVISWAGELEDAQKQVRQNPNSADAHYGEKIAIFDCQPRQIQRTPTALRSSLESRAINTFQMPLMLITMLKFSGNTSLTRWGLARQR